MPSLMPYARKLTVHLAGINCSFSTKNISSLCTIPQPTLCRVSLHLINMVQDASPSPDGDGIRKGDLLGGLLEQMGKSREKWENHLLTIASTHRA